MKTNQFLARLVLLVLVAAALAWGVPLARALAQTADGPQAAAAPAPTSDGTVTREIPQNRMRSMTNAQRQAAAARAAARRASKPKPLLGLATAALPTLDPQGKPDYFNVPNWTNSPLLRKFVDTLPGLGPGNVNNLGQYIPVANPDTITYPGSDYYEIALVEYSEQLHSDLPKTKLRGYVQLNNGTDPITHLNTVAPAPVHYLGPIINAMRDRPVRVKFTNKLPTGAGGNLFLPVDTSVMGAGMGPEGMMPSTGPMNYSQNRATMHLHGGVTPWISDGTPHQWTTPAGENTAYPRGVSVHNVPDMPDPGPGSLTFFYTNQQSARLMWYHDHTYGMTRLNVYAGEAAGYLLSDPVEQAMINDGTIPATQVPLIIQDKTFVPDIPTLAATDPTWDIANWGAPGNLWFPHVYMPNQNPADLGGANAFGRWDYGPWFWPPVSPSLLKFPPIASVPGGPLDTPGTPNPSMTMESFMDTPLVNGTAYPTFTVQRKAYRFRILNASNERYYNLQLYYVDPASPTEVKMVPAAPHPGDPTWPALWPTDGRDGGVPDPATAGPKMIQIGTEGGILPAPVVLDNTPVGYNYNRRDIVVLNVMNKTLFLGPAERADVIVDFSGVPDGSKIILYNDAGSPVPAFDTRYDYYTGDPDQTSTGGAPTTLPGYGPNTRTIMRFDVAGATAAPAFDLPRLTAALPVAFAASQPPMIVPQVADGAAKNTYAKIQDTSMTFTPLGGGASITIPMEPKTIQELFELDYGRMNSTLGVELPFTNFNTQTTIPLGFIDPPTEFIQHGVNQLWKITHNGVDTHAIHVHLFNVQLINRVGWDGAIRPPDANELGWKETVRMNPLEDAIVAFQPIEPALPFGIPVSERPMDPTMPLGSMMGFSPVDPLGNPTTTVNAMVNYGHEYVWHCHLLGHEEMDMMRPIVLQTGDVLPSAPSNLTVTVVGTTANLSWTDPTPAATSLGNPANEIGFRIERATNGGAFAPFSTALANATTSADTALLPLMYYQYRVIAYNAAGDSAPSNIADALSTVPGAPTIGTAVAGNAQATVSFSAPAFNGGKAITAYTVTSNPGGITATGVASPLTVTGLTNGTTYTFTVTATNANGTGLPSAASNSVIPATVPDAPTIGAAVRGNAQATVSFTAPAFNGGSAITAYTVTSNPGGKTATGAASPLTVTGLTNGTAYTFTVTATNVIGTSLPSTASNSVTPATVPGAPTNVTAAVASSTSATVSFTAPSANGSAITSYTVTSNPGGKIATGAAGPLTVTGLTSGSTYTFTVKATNALGTGATSSVSNSLTLTRPAAPTKLVATGSVLSVNPPTVSLSWVDNATNETGYTILRSTSTFFVAGLTTFTVAAGVTTFVDTTVLGRTSYYYRVFATNPIGSSANSNTASITTAGQLPLAPTNLTVGSITRSAITVNWIDNATTEQGFYVERSTAGTNGPWTRVATVTANKVTYTNTGLKANTSYWYRVNAYNASGVTPYTNVVTGKTLP